MSGFSKKISLAFTLALFLPLYALLGQKSRGEFYGDKFYRVEQYLFAQLEYEKSLSDTNNRREDLARIRAKIALSLMRMHKYKTSLSFLTNLSFGEMYLKSYALLKIGRINQARFVFAGISALPDMFSLEKERAKLIQGTLFLNSYEYDKAINFYSNLAKKSEHSDVNLMARRVLKDIKSYKKIPRKSPLLAGIFSSILPGSGQIYSHFDTDGIIAFFYNSAFLGASAYMYHLETKAEMQHSGSLILGLLGLLFYASNIVGAYAAAKRYNLYIERDFQQRIRDKIFNLDYMEKTSQIKFSTKF